MKKTLAVVLVVLMLFSLMFAASGCSMFRGKGFSTPEDAIEAFFKALKKQDLDGMIACTNIDPYLENFSMEDYCDTIGAFSALHSIAPTEYELYKDIMRAQIISGFASNIKIMSYSLLYDEIDAELITNYIPTDDLDIDDLIEEVDPKPLETLELIRIDVNNEDLQTDKKYQKSNAVKICGADSIAERIALIEVDGDLFYKGFTLVEYDGKWYIRGFSAVLFGEDSLGLATPIDSEDDFDDMIDATN